MDYKCNAQHSHLWHKSVEKYEGKQSFPDGILGFQIAFKTQLRESSLVKKNKTVSLMNRFETPKYNLGVNFPV